MPENNKTKKTSAAKPEKKTPVQDRKNNVKKTQKKSVKVEPKRKRHDDKLLLLKEEIAGKQAKKTSPSAARRSAAVKITALGGLSEIGKNLYVIECSNDLFIIDCGLAFPDEDMLGVDLVIPDFTYLEKNRERFRGVVLTHGHEDHIGSLPYLLKKINVPVYGTKLTLGLCEGKLREHGILNECSLNVVQPRQTVKLGCMSVEFIRVNHSIPDACALAVHTPAGIIVHTGDFKVDYTPIEGGIIDLARFGELGNKGVLALMSDSTNAERPGYTMSERKVGDSFRNIFGSAENRRVIVATFASNIHRIQQIIDNAVFYGRKIALSGRSMINVIQKAIELGYVKIPSGFLIDIEQVNKYPPEKVVVVTTGSQGEPLSALSRMSAGDHRQVNISPCDLVVISASPIPGNEKTVGRVINDLMKSGAEVVYESMYEVHVSGHACQDELKMMLSLTKPKFFIPVHGEYKHLVKHAQLAVKMGVPEENIFIAGLGQQLETDSNSMQISTQVTAGKILVDGLGVGDVGTVVLRDRKKLAQDGLIIVVASIERGSGRLMSGPDIVSRGFVYVRESEELIDEARELMEEAVTDSAGSSISVMKNNIRDAMSDFMFRKTKRSPMILPIIMEV
ncbi:MAG: ribonuclease J [Oscillospiraceae bacterium]|jgi:ribonuclease J|nr:ribonuclease J [Oscillospiraceae bacterium]